MCQPSQTGWNRSAGSWDGPFLKPICAVRDRALLHDIPVRGHQHMRDIVRHNRAGNEVRRRTRHGVWVAVQEHDDLEGEKTANSIESI